MKKILLLVFCFLTCFSCQLVANDDLLKLFHIAAENGDVKLVTEVIEALLKEKSNNKNLLESLAKYSEKGKVDFALHNALKDKNLLASVILAHHAKDVNTRKGYDAVWIASNHGCSRRSKRPLELALESNMIGMIPYLLMKNADIYTTEAVEFLYEEEENVGYIVELGYEAKKEICVKSKKVFFHVSPFKFSRTFIGEVISKNRLDVIEILQKTIETLQKKPVDWNKTCCTVMGTNFTPLQFALAIKRYEIAQFLIDHGARIE